MGLFFETVGSAARESTSTVKRVTRITEAEKQYLTCAHCSLNNERMVHPKLPANGIAQPLVYFFGSSPTKADDDAARHFAGSSSEFLRKYLPNDIDDYARWDNVLRCRTPGGRDPLALEIECCRKLHAADFAQSQPAVIVALGKHALHWFMGSDKQLHIWRGRRAPVRVGSSYAWVYFVEHPEDIMRKQNDRKYGAAHVAAFAHDLQRVFHDIENDLPEPYVEHPVDYKKGIELLSAYGSDGLQRVEQVLQQYANIDHAHDIETDRLKPYGGEPKILSVAIGTYAHTFAFGWEHAEARWSAREHKRLAEMLEAYLMGRGKKWAHEAKFEMAWWRERFGPKVVFDTEWEDTIGQAHVLDERGSDDRGSAKGLGDLTQLHMGFDVKALSPIDRKKLATTPLHYVLPYNGLDTKYTYALSRIQADLIARDGKLQSVYELLNGFTPATVTLQAKGVVRNMVAIKQLHQEISGKVDATLQKIMGNADVQRYVSTGRKFKPSSGPDLIAFFRDFMKIPSPRKTKKGEEEKYSVDDDVLSLIKHPVAAFVRLHRKHSDNLSYITPLLDGGKYVSDDGLVHALYSQYVTGSGRYACRDPNQQNYPRRGPEAKMVRSVIGVRRGMRFIAFDYGQLEWRVGAALSRDVRMRNELLDPKHDIHGHWTSSLGAAFAPAMLRDNRKGLRDALKNDWTFSNLYGNSPSAIAYMLAKIFDRDLRESDILPHYDEFWDTYPDLKKYQDELMRVYWEKGYVETGTYQRRREPLARNEGINHPFQGTGGHLVIDAQSRISRFAYEHDRPQLQPIMNMHDDLSFELSDAQLERNVEDIVRMMLTGLFPFIDVPMLVECSISAVDGNWAEKQELGKFLCSDRQTIREV